MRTTVVLSLLLVTGCTSGSLGTGVPSSSTGTSSSNSWALLAQTNGFARPAHQVLLYAGGPNTNEVDVYSAYKDNPAPRDHITTGLDIPTGMALDNTGNLYVANNAGQSVPGKSVYWTVTVYGHGHNRLIRTYTDGVASPVDVTIGPDNTVFIANFSNGVTVYPSGSVHPVLTLRGPSGYSSLGVATESKGAVFVSWLQPYGGGGRIYKYRPGKAHGRDLGIAFDGEPHGLAVDDRGNLIVAVSKAPNPGSDVEIFGSGKTKPKQRITGPFQPFMVALDHPNSTLFVADYGSGNNDGGVFVYDYPSGKLLAKDTQGAAGGAYGVAIHS
jgi:sugar lactone lactonase YvrE